MPEHSITHTIPITNPPVRSQSADHAAGGRRARSCRSLDRAVVAAGFSACWRFPDLVALLVRVVSVVDWSTCGGERVHRCDVRVVGSALVVRKRGVVVRGARVPAGWSSSPLVTVLRMRSLGHVPRILLDSPIEIGMFWVEVVTAVVLLGVLWSIRGSFTARLAPGSFRRAVVNLGIGVAVAAIVGIALTELFPGSLQGQRRQVIWPLRTALGLMPDPTRAVLRRTGERWVAVT